MKRSTHVGLFAILAAFGLILSSCATVDRTSAQAQAGAPVAAQVEVVSIPYNPNLPRFVVAVAPFDYGASGITSGNSIARAPSPDGSLGAIVFGGLDEGGGSPISHQSGPGAQVGNGMSAQLVTALTRCGNISVVEPDMIESNPDGTYTCKMLDGEVGPFVIKGMVTEFNETADLEEKKRGGSLGLAGAALGIAGAVTGSDALAITGGGIAAANPTYENKKMTRMGMVGMDLQLIDGRTRRIVQGYNASGTFKTVSATSGLSVFGIGGGDAQFAASALGQATRAAMNDAVQKTMTALSFAPR